VPGRVVLSDDALSAAREMGGSVDPAAALALMSMEFIPGTRTLAREVEELPPASITRFTISKSVERRTDSYWSPRVVEGRGSVREEDMEAELAGLLGTMADEWCAALGAALPAGGKVAVPLSGGLDSRILIALFGPRLGDRFVALTYGNPESEDVRLAVAAATAAGVTHRLLQFRSGEFLNADRRNHLARTIGMTTRLTLADGGHALATAFGSMTPEGERDVCFFLPGHSGDGVSGSRIQPGQEALANPAGVLDVVRRSHLVCFPREATRGLLLEPLRGLAGSADAGLAKNVASHTGATARETTQRWLMHELVRRRVLTELPLYRQRTQALLPFFDLRLVEFFERLPARYLMRQRLYVNTALKHLFTGRLAPLADVPRQGYGRLHPKGDGDGGFDAARLGKRLYNKVLRTVSPAAFERRVSSCPMYWLWKSDRAWRGEIRRELEQARVLPQIFDQAALRRYLDGRLGRDYHLTTLGLWGLLTVELAGRAMEGGEVSPGAPWE
jgi:asparagine synthase (glutamine-hydrolysing)